MSKRSYQELEQAWSEISAGPTDRGEIHLLVTRARASAMPKDQDKLSEPIHLQPQKIHFSTEFGVQNDRWKPGKAIGAQISLTSLAVTKLIAGSTKQWHLMGNNLIVDMDLSENNLPIGTRLQVGMGEIQLSDVAHEPCDRYQARFGKTAHDWVLKHSKNSNRLRGRLATVTKNGCVSVGQRIFIVKR